MSFNVKCQEMSTVSKDNAFGTHDDLKTNIKFLKMIEKYECLWKHDSPNYTNNHVKIQAWKQIAKAVNSTEEKCSRRWRYIRQAYSQHVRTATNGDPRRTNYYLSPHVDFVKPYIKMPSCFSKSDMTKEKYKDNSQNTEETTKKQNRNEDPVETETLLERQFLELIEGIGENSNTKEDKVDDGRKIEQNTSHSSLKRKKGVQGTEQKSKLSKTEKPNESDVSKNWMFLESILPFVDEMSKKQISRFRRKVMSLLEDILENKTIDTPELVK